LIAVRLIGPADVVAAHKAHLIKHFQTVYGPAATCRTSTRHASHIGECRIYLTAILERAHRHARKTVAAQRKPALRPTGNHTMSATVYLFPDRPEPPPPDTDGFTTVGQLGDSGVYTVKEVSRYLRLSLGGTYTLIRSGEIPAKKLGGRWVIPKRRFAAWLDSCRGED
jgi:excisionase family DNA binding protein